MTSEDMLPNLDLDLVQDGDVTVTVSVDVHRKESDGWRWTAGGADSLVLPESLARDVAYRLFEELGERLEELGREEEGTAEVKSE